MKIKISANWTSSSNVTRRLLDQFKTDEIDLTGISFVHDDSYDIIIYFGYISEPMKVGTRGYLFPQEPTWTGGHQRHYDNMPDLTVFGFDRGNYYGDAKFVETFAHMFYGGIGPDGEGWDDWKFDNLKNINPEKTKNICSTVSNRGEGWDSYHSDCLYPQRCKLIKSIQHLDYIDFYGGWSNNTSNTKGFKSHKYDAILPYKFVLTIENSNENYYVSEKFFDPILVNAVPIYFGCKNIKTLFPENGYIHLDNITDTDKIMQQLIYINSNADEIYNTMLPEVLKIKKRFFSEHNPLNKIVNIVNNKN